MLMIGLVYALDVERRLLVAAVRISSEIVE